MLLVCGGGGGGARQHALWDEWFTARAWKSQPRPDEYLPWDSLPLHSVLAPTIGCILYISGLIIVPIVRKGKPPLSFPRLVRRRADTLRVLPWGGGGGFPPDPEVDSTRRVM